MNQNITGLTIKNLRKQMKLTQSQLAEKLNVSDKTISKWETGKGLPDIALIESIAKALNSSISELMTGETVFNKNICGNVLKTNFYSCPICGNILYSLGDAQISCHGNILKPLIAKEKDMKHELNIEINDGDIYVTSSHCMEKSHYISFIAAISIDKIQFQKLYPECEINSRFSISGVKYIVAYCNKDGLYSYKLNR